MHTNGKSSKPFHVMGKPIGPKCNIDCRYCFYLEKEGLFPNERSWKMNDETLERFIQQYIAAQPTDSVTFAWQGGEPTLLGVKYFRKVVELQQKHACGKTIENAFQTNGTLLDEEWGTFLHDNNFLVGLSIDGPEAIHNKNRVDKKDRGTFRQVMKGLEILKKHKVEFNTLTCVSRANADKPLDVYRFLRGIGSRYMQFIPIVERKPNTEAKELGLWLGTPDGEPDDNPGMMPWSVKAVQWGSFLNTIFDRWVRHDVGRYYVQMFDVAFSKWLGIGGGLCVHDETCGYALAMEHDGSIYSCDHFVYPKYKLGNVLNQDLSSMVESEQQLKFGRDKKDSLPGQCQRCEVRFACNGGCPKQRFIETKDGEAGLNYLCEGYYAFFTHVDPYMKVMADLYRRQMPPAYIMEMFKDPTFSPAGNRREP